MQVLRLGYAAVKGTRHLTRERVSLTPDGVAGDRAFCLVDPATGRVLKTVENPSLTSIEARTDDDGTLRLRFPDGTEIRGRLDAEDGEPITADAESSLDYWGRAVTARLLDGPHAAAVTAYLGLPVRLAATDPGDVVWAGAVSLVTTGELARLGERLRASGGTAPEALDERFRATITLDTDADPLPGTLLRIGSATVEVGRRIDRCAVVDVDPSTGRRSEPVLAHLERHDGLLTFGVDARVVEPGRIEVGDLATPANPQH
ncbi:MOSC N-terminal beta barrel domain-containing protein [Pedococcus dokdonensis]|uniref:MOSC N-terminal beta barrel domain-containing protein n=1 Tax=Pedococcus dokdonensis TaxID=443156 RepID=A0A1H0TN67_9MICO|nr:MOSC N-terminal beta barrel domain-containing protein [Pedococcus dokdonensis]SDP54996.1 MOSC N-terminal beta barrel domain-containing protein [Pedococcus dokdonensis]